MIKPIALTFLFATYYNPSLPHEPITRVTQFTTAAECETARSSLQKAAPVNTYIFCAQARSN